MEGAIPRHRYTRSSAYQRKKKRSNHDSITFMGKILKQTFFCSCILISILVVKNINTPVTNFVSEKVKTSVFQNIEVKQVYTNLDDFFSGLLKSKSNKEEVVPKGTNKSTNEDS